MHRHRPSPDNRGGRASLLLLLAAMAAIAGACGHSSPQAGSTSTTAEDRSTTPVPTTAPAAITAGPTTTGPTTSGSTAPTRATATTLVTTTAKTATTTPPKSRWAPPSPQPTPSQAAYALVNAWAGHDRSVALMDASPAAVAALFFYRYPAGGPQYRGCSTPPGNAPGSCVWRSGDELLSLTVTYFSNGYGVTAAIMEN
jgi:hypothetical protein